MLSDGVATFIAYFIAVELRFSFLNGFASVQMYSGMFIGMMLAYSAAMVLVYYMLHIYTPQRLNQIGSNNLRIILANAVGALALMAAFYIVRIVDVSRLVIVLFYGVSSLLVTCKQTVLHLLLRYYRTKGYNQKHFILVGNGRLAHQYLEDNRNNPDLGICVDGYVSRVQKPDLGVCLGSYEELEKILEEHEYDGLIVALEPHETRFM